MATKSQEILLKGNTTNASAVPSSLKVREIAINALDRSLFTNDGNSIVKLYTGTTKWFDVNGNANNALKADSVAWANITNKPSTFTPSAHTHTASDVSGLPTSLKNPYALTFGSKTYDGSAAATITASDLGALTSITKSMVEGVLTGDITSHTHTFASLTSKPTTLSGYGITDNVAYRSNWNNFIHNDNEFTFASPAYSGFIYINYRTSSGAVDGAITEYRFARGDGNSYADIRAAKYIVYGGTSSQFLKGDGSLDSTAYLPLSGGTMTGIITMKKSSASGDAIYWVETTNSNHRLGFGEGASGSRGIFDSALGWVFKIDTSNNVTISGNATSATKLQTPHNIWGQSFNGTGDITGVLRLPGKINVSLDAYLDNQTYDGLNIRTSSYSYMLIGSKVGIGTTNPQYKLDVNGTGHYAGDLIVDGEVSVLVA